MKLVTLPMIDTDELTAEEKSKSVTITQLFMYEFTCPLCGAENSMKIQSLDKDFDKIDFKCSGCKEGLVPVELKVDASFL